MTLAIPHFSHLYIPSECPKEESYLMVLLHGRGGSMQDFEELGEIFQIPQMAYLLLNAPDPFFNGRSWYDRPPSPLPGILRSRQYLTDLFDTLPSLGHPHERCFMFGFSQGALLTLEFGGRYPHTLAGYMPMCGQCYDVWPLIAESAAAAKKGHWLWLAGTYDEHFGIETTRLQASHLKESGWNLELREYPKGHEVHYEKELPELKRWLLEHMG